MTYTGFFLDTPYKVVDGNIVYASDLNNPLAALKTGIASLVDSIQTGATIQTAVDTGVVNAYKINPTAAPTEYADGLMVWLKPTVTNTGASTIDVSDLGVKTIRSTIRSALVGGELLAGHWHQLKYSGTLGVFEIVSEPGRTDSDTSKTIAGSGGITVTSDDTTITVSIEDGDIATEKLADDAVTQEKIASSVSFGPKAIQVFTGDGTYTPTAGCTVAIVEVVGGGGEGADSNTYASGGGGGGGYSRKRISLAEITTVAVTVGAGGSGGTTTGGNGGTSSFGAHCSATGGSGSVATGASKPVGGNGGAGSGGDVNITGDKGDTGEIVGGNGGSSVFGGSGKGTFSGVSAAGTGPGGGGAGGGQDTGTGGNGANGIVIVTEY